MQIDSLASPENPVTPLPRKTPVSEERSQFLTLLTAQIENQDPLEPLDANQFIEQLATINALEQQIQTNEYLAEMVGLLRGLEDPAA